jgi:hypothetical protein
MASNFGVVLYGHRYSGIDEFVEDIEHNFIINVNPSDNRNDPSSVCQWEDFKELVPELLTYENYDAFTINRIDDLYEMCVDYVCELEGEEHPSTSGAKKLILWRKIRQEMEEVLTEFNSLEARKFYVSKVVLVEIDNSFLKGTALFPFTEDNWVLREILPNITKQTLYFYVETVKARSKKTGKEKLIDKKFINASLKPDVFAGDTTNKLPNKFESNYETYKKEMLK